MIWHQKQWIASEPLSRPRNYPFLLYGGTAVLMMAIYQENSIAGTGVSVMLHACALHLLILFTNMTASMICSNPGLSFFFQASYPITVSNLLWLFGIEQNTFNWSILINWACWWRMMWSWYASLLATISNGCLAVRQNSPQIWFHRQKAKLFETWDLACTCYTSIYWYILE